MNLPRLRNLLLVLTAVLLIACSKNEKNREIPQPDNGIPIAKIVDGDFKLIYEDDPQIYWGFFIESYDESNPENLTLKLKEDWKVKVIADDSKGKDDPNPAVTKYYLTTYAYDHKENREVFLRLGLNKSEELLVLKERGRNYLQLYFCKACKNNEKASLKWDESWNNVKCESDNSGVLCDRAERTYGENNLASSTQ